ncbi:siderophore-interacting protein [Mycobacterium sp. ACS4331]|uniref:siderophore-interacting protein n=1 Tax=Mycobacterium sp. ACS4331 TaxID=1834121 RepID=UPI001E5ECB5D|nr:siderophore-interacting protein [Mycobacterium sp. ACS4331]
MFRRIGLLIEDPESLGVAPAPDSAVGVYFSPGDPMGQGRTYTVRRQLGSRIEIDVLVHSEGPGATWARTAREGQRVELDHARSWYRTPASAGWQLLVCDLSGLPAAARILEQISPGTPVVVVAEVLDDAHLDSLMVGSDVTVVSSVGTGNGTGPSRLAAMVQDLQLPQDAGYCWFGGEAAQSRTVRTHLRARGWTIDQTDIAGYWRWNSKDWDVRYALVADRLFADYQRAVAAGRGEKVAAEEFDEALEREGL